MKSNLLKNNVLVVGQSCVHQEVTQALGDDYQIIALDKAANLLALIIELPTISCVIIEYTEKILLEICTLKAHFKTYSIPIIAILSTLCPETMHQIVQSGIDDFIQKPLVAQALQMRMSINTTRSLRNQNTNPLTKLPGNELVTTTITNRLSQSFAMVYADLDHFKAYNDVYGFAQGDQLLLALAHILVNTTQTLGNPTDFVGHVGGDDFAIISTPDKAELIAQKVCVQFDQLAPSFYNEHDRTQKKIVTFNRQGDVQEFPLITLSCVLVSNATRTLSSTAHVAQIIAELKRYAKNKPDGVIRSNYVKDRRTK
ncbi:diguanylate cyclase [Candidatus Dependentiae bacterium]|jgi:diguanylate cyclase (GGDEF)-like protein|nr:diguanylate cyclase [Candidatus Dependentiae bacterium]